MFQSDGRLLPILALCAGLVISGACVLWLHAQDASVSAGEALAAAAEADKATLERYLADDGDPNIFAADGRPLLHVALASDQAGAIVDLMLRHGADPNLKTREGETALMQAVAACSLDQVAKLIDAGARVGPVNSKGLSALDLVCRGSARQEIIALLRRKLFLQARGN